MEDAIVSCVRVINLKDTIFWDITPCNPAYFLTLKMEAICSFETSGDSHWTTRRYIPEDGTIRICSCENLKSYA
jgi:hypothetical protein